MPRSIIGTANARDPSTQITDHLPQTMKTARYRSATYLIGMLLYFELHTGTVPSTETLHTLPFGTLDPVREIVLRTLSKAVSSGVTREYRGCTRLGKYGNWISLFKEI